MCVVRRLLLGKYVYVMAGRRRLPGGVPKMIQNPFYLLPEL